MEDLEARVSRYLEERLEQYAGWYDAKAVKLKKAHLRSRVTAAVAAVTIPVIANVSLPVTVGDYSADLAGLAVSAVGLLVAILLALEGVLHHKDQWTNYRTTEQFLRTQRILYENGVGEYEGLDDETRFKLLVTNAEAAIKNENEVTLNVLTRADSQDAAPDAAT